MILEMKVPSPGESITKVEIATWLVADGDYVEKDQIIAELDSDKATLELPAEEGGVITLKVQEGDSVDVGQVVCLIDTSKGGEAKNNLEPESKEESAISKIEAETVNANKSDILSPAAKKIISENNIKIEDIKGTGKDGRITKQDVMMAKPSMGSIADGNRVEKRTKLSLLRRKVAERLVSVKNDTAMLTTFNEVDMSAIFELRNGVNLGFMSFFTLACVRALKEFPSVNSMIDGKEMITYQYYDISIAVSGPKGLMVPVIRHAEKLSFKEIEIQVKTLAERARDSKITVDEMTGGTFTISNGGVFGSMLSTPIINPPQSAILGMHNIVERPIVVDGKVEIRPVMYLALSYDHRIIDGSESVGFLVTIKEALESPAEILMENKILESLELK
ncbi:MAG TPA: 2-oxoglutarate dehydrogenase complex dihydrolipoyllysine-residue succinyltransferase [Flavobacteriaceae bacterium]|nr:2-oxoglutarate dehydrogenase complex dihydrolipoyllysine-residue succinyltransferase [Flavobacteriaceae bacterium]